MVIEFSFPDLGAIRPEIYIRHEGHCTRIKNPKWVQFLAILAHRRLKGIYNGIVRLEELVYLLGFARSTPQTIGKYLANSYSRFPFPATTFFSKYLSISTTGPYQLLVLPSNISTDIALLEQYVTLIYRPLPGRQYDANEWWELALRSLDTCELTTAQHSFEQCLRASNADKGFPSTNVPLLRIHQATTEYLGYAVTPRIARWLTKAKEEANLVRSSHIRDLLIAYALGTEVWMDPMESCGVQRTIEKNLRAIELTEALPKRNLDRACLLASRYYHRVYTALRFGTSEMVKDGMKKVLELHRQIEEEGPPKLIPYEPGLPKILSLQLDVIKCVSSGSPMLQDSISRYEICRIDPTITRVNTLSVGEWIANGLIRTKKYDQARLFLSDALVDHASLHETVLYRRMALLRRSIGRPPEKQ